MEVMQKLAFVVASIYPGSPPQRQPPIPYRMFAPYRGLGVIYATKGWISVDRGSKATLPLTMPHRVFKSSAKDSARRPCGISLPDGHPWLYHHGGYTGDTSPWGPKAPTVGREANDGRERRLLARILT